MAKSQTVINLDPIDRKKKKNKGLIQRLLVTTWHGGPAIQKSEPFGHYMFCGKQRSGKTASVLWFTEWTIKKYRKKRIRHYDEDKGRFIKFDTPPKIMLYSNFGVGIQFNKEQIFDLIDKFDPYSNEIRIVLIDEFHTYFPKGSTRKEDKETLAQLTGVFSQLAKRNCFVFSTAQVYGRLDKALREQCLYMVDNHVNFRNRIVSEFILETDIICDDLGRWAGDPQKIRVHGLSKLKYDTKRLIRQ